MTEKFSNPILLDGKALAHQVEVELASRVRSLGQKLGGMVPVLATILVGGDPSSATYVREKKGDRSIFRKDAVQGCLVCRYKS
tara:strand:- start:3936 stop:4184 length:249 start_codon:yes stop_codon:yes gene_type:complete